MVARKIKIVHPGGAAHGIQNFIHGSGFHALAVKQIARNDHGADGILCSVFRQPQKRVYDLGVSGGCLCLC